MLKIKTDVYLSKFALSIIDDIHANTQETADKLADHMCVSQFDMTQFGYVKVGEAVCQVTIFPKPDVLKNHVAAFDAEIDKIRAEFQSKIKVLEEAKRNLLSITYEVN